MSSPLIIKPAPLIPRYHKVPVVRATTENFHRFGRFVFDFHKEQVIITPWPGRKRPVQEPSGCGGGVVVGDFDLHWQGKELKLDWKIEEAKANNYGVRGNYTVGVLAEDLPNTFLVREAGYHPDGGQVTMPTDGRSFIALMAPPGDDLTPEHFVAFFFDGSFGFQMFPGVWHQPPIPLATKQYYFNKQGAIHACVQVDTVDEFGCWLSIELQNSQNCETVLDYKLC